MTKQQAAAYDYMRGYRFEESPPPIDAFVAGARWALEQMTSEAMVNVAFNAKMPGKTGAQSLDPLPPMRAPREHYAVALAAVRKEIEG